MMNEENTIYVLVAGSRTITNDTAVFSLIDKVFEKYDILLNYENVIIVEGAADGVDTCAKHYATRHGHRIMEFPADWNRFGNMAGFKRNEDMHRFIHEKKYRMVICLKDLESTGKGTTHSIDLSKRYCNPLVWCERNPNGTITINDINMNGGRLK